MSTRQGVCVLGATGSIGSSTLDVIARHPDKFKLVAVTAFSNVKKMQEVCVKYQPQTVVMVDDAAAEKLSKLINSAIKILSGTNALNMVVTLDEVDYVMAAIVGGAGLHSSLAAIRANKKLLLANKESLVMSGKIFMSELASSRAELIPIDSEHNAIFQCLPDDFTVGSKLVGVNRILLTGSGGPFLHEDIESLKDKTPAEAISHPNWSMGAKISVDSASMMNKGLEWIEAKWLFGIDDEALEIVVHPQSVIHSMVEFNDGSTLAQMGQSDMRIPIAHALGLPVRIKSGTYGLNFYNLPDLQFIKPDLDKFPALKLARAAWDQGGNASVILNAANEIAVQSFLAEKIKFTQIVKVIEHTLETMNIETADNLDKVMQADQTARIVATNKIRDWK